MHVCVCVRWVLAIAHARALCVKMWMCVGAHVFLYIGYFRSRSMCDAPDAIHIYMCVCVCCPVPCVCRIPGYTHTHAIVVAIYITHTHTRRPDIRLHQWSEWTVITCVYINKRVHRNSRAAIAGETARALTWSIQQQVRANVCEWIERRGCGLDMCNGCMADGGGIGDMMMKCMHASMCCETVYRTAHIEREREIALKRNRARVPL